MPATLTQVRSRLEEAGTEPLVVSFAELLFEKADPRLLETFGAESLGRIAAHGFRFLDSLRDGQMRVEVFNPTRDAHGWEAPYTVLMLALRDRPFIVDSVQAELRRRGFAIAHLLHPIYTVSRNPQGRITGVAARGSAGHQEAFEIWFLEREESQGRLEELQRAIRRGLGDVVLATNDYAAMRDQLGEVRRYLQDLEGRAPVLDAAREDISEYADFLRWLDDDNFVFLGYREYDIVSAGEERLLQVNEDSGLGILRRIERSAYREPTPLAELPEALKERVVGGRLFVVTKTNAESTVHRPARMDYIGVKKVDAAGEVTGEMRFLGLLTSKALSTPVEEIPILRRRLRQVLELDGAIPDSHDYKGIISTFNSMPREEIFWSDAAQLHEDIRTIMTLEQEREVRLSVRPDPLARGYAVMVVMPRDHFNSQVRRRIQQFLAAALEATHVDYQLAMGEDEAQVRFHFFFNSQVDLERLDLQALEREVAELSRSWDDELRARLIAEHGQADGRRLAQSYEGAFDERYRADISPAGALRDVENLEALGDSDYRVDLVEPTQALTGEEPGERVSLLRIYHRLTTLVLSDVLPVLENLGLRVLEQVAYLARTPHGRRSIDVFRVQNLAGEPLDVARDAQRLIAALERLLSGDAESDRLNGLVLSAGLDVRKVALLRAYLMYYGQLSASTSRRFLNETMLAHPDSAAAIYRYFEVRFDPAFAGERAAELQRAREAFEATLANVSSLPEDQALRGVFNLIEATVRNNYYMGKEYIAFKIASRDVTSMPEPRPLFEIGVSSPTVDGVHLRGGMVARGGIRWSDRPDDFRTEVLGLMKTQTTKNAVIVPVGSKGGFVVKNAPPGRDELFAYVREQYRTYIRGLLDLTDNIVDGETVTNPGLVTYDEPDTYMVVAADKGTATFSDTANATAAEYGFWLGDAFASGGSHGYDHKKVGITARGAWQTVARHFREIGIDVGRDTFTAAGIGDMSGDVFGNGMLYSDRTKLVAAFNHLHIFIDPDPDPERSYAERKRLFELPRSTWRDYDTALISEGGGVFDRSAKSIRLTPQMKSLLAVDADELSGQELIRAVLRMPVDLLWNGGIGTYVRSSAESDVEVGDSGNDAVRVSADGLRARVVGEGGNLGFTQRARIEYALGGGRINTDFIDNSGGVDMSDHEVNIKILFQGALANGELTIEERNELLEEMTEEVTALVLSDNYSQSLALSLAEKRSSEDPQLFESLQAYLAERGGLDEAVEAMPSPRQLAERRRHDQSYTRPELAVIMAYAKMGLYRRLLETDFPEEPRFQHYLFAYFPAVLQKRFPDAIREHPLRREIVATQFTNTVVDMLGVTFVHRTIRDTGSTPVEVIRAALIALEMLDVRQFLDQVFALDNVVPAQAQYAALTEMVAAVEGIVTWILLSDLTRMPAEAFVTTYREPLTELRGRLREFLPERPGRAYDERAARFVEAGFDETLAREVAAFDYLPSSLGLIEAAQRTGAPLPVAAQHFYGLGERLWLGWLRDRLSELNMDSKWEKMALGGLIMELRRAQRDLSSAFLSALQQEPGLEVEQFLARYPQMLRRYDQALAELREEEGALGLASGGVLARLLTQAELPAA